MGFFKKLLDGGAADREAARQALSGNATLFLRDLSVHRERMTSAGPAHASFLRKYLDDEVMLKLAPLAGDKMGLTQADGEEHSLMITKPPVAYVVCTVPITIGTAPMWFQRRYGGYGELLSRCWNSTMYRESGCQVLCHITNGRTTTKDTWVNVTIWPTDSSKFPFYPIVATDLLSPTERQLIDAKLRQGDFTSFVERQIQSKQAELICDICGKRSSRNEIKTINANGIVSASSKGYVPSNLPASWKVECDTLGISLASLWRRMVDVYSSASWGLCATCFAELDGFNSRVAGPDNASHRVSRPAGTGQTDNMPSVACPDCGALMVYTRATCPKCKRNMIGIGPHPKEEPPQVPRTRRWAFWR